MVNVKDKICIYEGCKVLPNYNNEGEKKALYCSMHKLDGMVNVVSKTCIHEGCKIQPTYNNEGETKALYCSTHKLDGMVNVKDKTCVHEGCKIRPNYNNEGETKALYCSTHKLAGMVNVKDKTCVHEGCKIIPNYNNEGKTKALYCSSHKLDGMVNVVSKTCIHEGCKIQPSYNNEGETKASYCSSHKLDGMVNVVSKTCKTYLCNTRVQDKYDGYCLFCYINLFPDKPVSRNYKTKEYASVEFIKNNFQDFSWITDKTIKDGCSKRRPDLLLDLGYQIIIVEIDENQHMDYDCSCENKRLMEISKDLGYRPIIFIRFNPDKYINKNNIITSCWNINKKGISVIKKSKKEEWIYRLNTLKEQINYWSNPINKISKTIEIIQLFYDI
jgi:hypothetical protein